MFCRYTLVTKLLLNNNDVFRFVTENSKRSRGSQDASIIHLNGATLFLSNQEDARLSVIVVASCINHQTVFGSIHPQAFNRFGKKVLSGPVTYTIV